MGSEVGNLRTFFDFEAPDDRYEGFDERLAIMGPPTGIWE
jgi:hypothetical protein